jgi:hypothetical protein
MIRNYGEDKEWVKERCGGAKEQQRRPSQVGVPIQVELESNSDSRNSRHQNRHQDHIQTPFWTFFIWIEREEGKLSNGTIHTCKFLLSPQKRRNNKAHIICHSVVLSYLGPVGYVSNWAQ